MRRNEYRKGGPHDDVANNIRREQQADAMPHPDEMEAMRKQEQQRHAEYKAAEAFLDHFDCGFSEFEFQAVASFLGFSQLEGRCKSSYNWRDWKAAHQEAHERRGVDTSHPQYQGPPPTVVDEDTRHLKMRAFLTVQDAIDDVEDVRADRKVLNPFGASKAWVVAIEHTESTHVNETSRTEVFTNQTFQKGLDRDRWNKERFEDDGGGGGYFRDTIQKYQAELREMMAGVIHGDG